MASPDALPLTANCQDMACTGASTALSPIVYSSRNSGGIALPPDSNRSAATKTPAL